jgi:hypothetical protein
MPKFRKSILASVARIQAGAAAMPALDISDCDFNALHGVMELLSVDVRAVSGGLVKFGHFGDPTIGGYLDLAEQKAVPGRFPLALVAINDSSSVEVAILTTHAACFPLTLSFVDDTGTHIMSATNDVELTQAIGRLACGSNFAKALLTLIEQQQNVVRH